MTHLETLFSQDKKSPLTIATEIVDYYRSMPRDLINSHPELLEAINNWHSSIQATDHQKTINLCIAYCNVYYYRILGDGENVFRWGLQAIYDHPTPKDAVYVGWIHRLISAMSFALGLTDQATEHANKALNIFLKIGDKEEIIRSYIQLGIAYDFTDNYALQLNYFNKSYELAKNIKDQDTMLIALNNSVFVHILRGEHNIAKPKLLELQDQLKTREPSRLTIGAKLNAVRIALHENDLITAKTLLEEVNSLKLLRADLTMYLDSILLYGRYYYKSNRIQDSLAAFQSGLKKSTHSNSKKYQLEFLHELAMVEKKLKNYKEALAHQESYINITKAIANDQASFHYLFLRVQYEIDQINHEVNLLKNQLNETQESAIYTLATLAEYKDQITGKHVLRTIEYVEAFCHLINENKILNQPLSKDYIDNFSRSSALHDIGKVGISEEILKKPGKLTPMEFESIKRHTQLGRDALAITETIMKRGSFLKLAEIIAYTHHEKWDGSGYPRGLKGQEIPFEGRLVAIIDVYDALISKRPYKAPYSHLEALAILEEGRGHHFDPTLLDVFLDNHKIFFEIAKRLLDSDAEKKNLSTQYQ